MSAASRWLLILLYCTLLYGAKMFGLPTHFLLISLYEALFLLGNEKATIRRAAQKDATQISLISRLWILNYFFRKHKNVLVVRINV